MPDLPNIKKEILEYILENADRPNDAVNLRAFAQKSEYSENRVAKKANELRSVLQWGVSPMHPWYPEREPVEERLKQFD